VALIWGFLLRPAIADYRNWPLADIDQCAAHVRFQG
jgi:hypothetical protein